MNTIIHTIHLLKTNDYYGVSKEVDIAKGKHSRPHTWGQTFKKIKRHIKSKRYAR